MFFAYCLNTLKSRVFVDVLFFLFQVVGLVFHFFVGKFPFVLCVFLVFLQFFFFFFWGGKFYFDFSMVYLGFWGYVSFIAGRGISLFLLSFVSFFVKRSLGLQRPSKKVLLGAFRSLSTFLEGIWSPRDLFCVLVLEGFSKHILGSLRTVTVAFWPLGGQSMGCEVGKELAVGQKLRYLFGNEYFLK